MEIHFHMLSNLVGEPLYFMELWISWVHLLKKLHQSTTEDAFDVNCSL